MGYSFVRLTSDSLWILEESGLNQKSPLKQLFLILYDLEREKRLSVYQTDNQEILQSGIHHRIRAKFEKMVTDFPQCTVGWRMYLAFEMKLGNQSFYENIFYRATGTFEKYYSVIMLLRNDCFNKTPLRNSLTSLRGSSLWSCSIFEMFKKNISHSIKVFILMLVFIFHIVSMNFYDRFLIVNCE